MKVLQKHLVLIGFLLILLWQFLLILQGVDLADTGFHLSAFTFIFDDPYSVQYSMSFWLSDVCGYLWMNIWPAGGLFWARIGWIVMISTTIIIYFYLLKPELGLKKTLIGLGVTTLFILQGGPECLNYDIFSILGYAISIILLYRSLTNQKPVLITISGLVIGITVFFKLTNLSGILLYLLIPFSAYLNRKTIWQFIRTSLLYLSGFTIGLVTVILLMKLTNQLNFFLDNLFFISDMTKDNEASHGFIPLLTSYLSGYFNTLISLLAAMIIITMYLWVSKKYKLHSKKRVSTFYYFGIILLTTLLMIILERPFWSKVRYLFIGLMLLEGIFTAFNRTRAANSRLLSLAGLLLLLIAPLGSDSGLEKSVFGTWILGPIVLTNLKFEHYFTKLKLQFTSKNLSFLQNTIILVVLVSSALFAWQNTYFDVGSRFEKTHKVNHPKMKNIYTSKERAVVLNEMIAKAFPIIKNKEFLLSFIEIPLVNYLSYKKPFISTSWPKLYYSPIAFENKLYEAVEERKTLPAIIRQKQNTMLEDWPKGQAISNYLDYPKGLSKWPEHGIILNSFIEKHNYNVVWENEMFQLLVPGIILKLNISKAYKISQIKKDEFIRFHMDV